MFRRLGLISRNQRGFTLVEVLIAIAITAVILGGISMAIFQLFEGNARATNHMTAVRQVQSAGYWVSHDTQMAQSVNATPTTGLLNLSWMKWDGSTANVTYSVVAGQLRRLSENTTAGTPPVTTVSTAVMAEHLDSIYTSCNFTIDGILIFTVKAKVGSGSRQASETRVYEVVPRPS